MTKGGLELDWLIYIARQHNMGSLMEYDFQHHKNAWGISRIIQNFKLETLDQLDKNIFNSGGWSRLTCSFMRLSNNLGNRFICLFICFSFLFCLSWIFLYQETLRSQRPFKTCCNLSKTESSDSQNCFLCNLLAAKRNGREVKRWPIKKVVLGWCLIWNFTSGKVESQKAQFCPLGVEKWVCFINNMSFHLSKK